LADVGISDTGLALLRGMDRLEYLDLAGTKVTDRGLADPPADPPPAADPDPRDPREAPYGQLKYAAAAATDRGMAEVAKTKTLQHSGSRASP